MATNNSKDTVLFITSYPPRACGIATFSQDLIGAISKTFSASFDIKICALEEPGMAHSYPDEVEYTVDTTKPEQCTALAERINANSDITAVCIQHEFGLFGGSYGENILYLLMNISKPVVVVFHTVLPHPDPQRKSLVETIGELAERIVVMTRSSARLIEKEYAVPAEKICVIPHGIHNVAVGDKEVFKEKFGLQGRKVLSTFGLMSSNKSIETALDALPGIVEKFPNTVYLVLGATHPGVVRHDGEKYRDMLEAKVRELGIENHVVFVNRYLTLDELLNYLRATDVYLFTSRDPHQAVSGTFSYALSCACPVIATSIPHATELLGEAGMIIDFQAPDQLAAAAVKLLGNDALRLEMSCRAYENTRPLLWENAAIGYARLFEKLTGTALRYTIPEMSIEHLRSMTDANGMIQFSNICMPDIKSGYTLDDNARALAVAALHYELTHDSADLPLLGTYLRFIECCQQADGRFFNYVSESGDFDSKNREVNLDDPNGRAIAALGFLCSKEDVPDSYRARAERCLLKAMRRISSIYSPRAMALAIRGLYYYNIGRGAANITELIDTLAARLASLYNTVAGSDWQWFEDYLTYKNAVLPEAMALAYRETGNKAYGAIAQASMNFLLHHTVVGNRFKPVSNRGWMHRGRPVVEHGEQPIEASSTIQALEQMYYAFGDERYRQLIDTAFSWFLGNNHLNQVIYNSATGGSHDGIEEDRINIHQGAESTLSYLVSQLVVIQLKRRTQHSEAEQYLLPAAALPRLFNRTA